MSNEKKARAYTSKRIKAALDKISPEEQLRTDRRMLLAGKIADGIDAKGWSRKQFADYLGKSPSEITRWLSGTHNFTADTLFDIQDSLGIVLIELKRPDIVTEIFHATFNVAIPAINLAPAYLLAHAPRMNFAPEWGQEQSVCIASKPERLVLHGR